MNARRDVSVKKGINNQVFATVGNLTK